MNTRNSARFGTSLLLFTVVLMSASLFVACGSDDSAGSVQVVAAPGDEQGYVGDGTAVVVINDETYVVTGDANGECVEIDGVCVDLDGAQGQHCKEEGAQMDVLVVDGEVVEVICYPPAEGTTIEDVQVDGDGNAEVPQNSSGAVIVFDESTDGEPIVGDVNMEAERVTLYGNGVDVTIIDGDVRMESNNSRVRALTITGNLSYTQNSNNSAASFCKIHGNLVVESNDFVATSCQVFGNVEISGNHPTLLNIGVGGEWTVADGALCDGCYSFDDADEDFMVADGEVGDEVLCEAR